MKPRHTTTTSKKDALAAWNAQRPLDAPEREAVRKKPRKLVDDEMPKEMLRDDD